jgi:hypothetical protein
LKLIGSNSCFASLISVRLKDTPQVEACIVSYFKAGMSQLPWNFVECWNSKTEEYGGIGG